MGNTSSQGDEDEAAYLDPFDGVDTLGYRVLGVQPNSPASAAGLVSFLDFLVGANDKMLLGSGAELEPGQEYDDIDLPSLLSEHKGAQVEFLVYNIKSQEARLVNVTPNDTWGGAGLLGATIRLDNYAGAEERLIRVLTVEPKSPAMVAGLVASKDFLLGTTHQTLESSQKLANLLQEFQDKVVELYVYNTDSDLVRIVALMPTLSWGGRGLLGAEVGTGYLHRLPAAACQTAGASVERKVRYVGVVDPPPSHAGSSDSAKQQQQQQRQVPNLSKNKQATTAVLELEPQLEMEADSEGDEASDASPAPGKTASKAETPPSAPPPPATGAVNGKAPPEQSAPSASFLPPPPPKMHYDTPPKMTS